MARFTIYSKDGKAERYTGSLQYNGTYLGVDFVSFHTVASPVVINWQIGDYVDYDRTNVRYKLYSLPQPKKVAKRNSYGAAFEYSNVQLFAPTKELEIAPFRDIVPGDSHIHFSTRPDVSTFEDVYGIAARIQACMDDLYPGKWRIEVYDTDDADLISLFEETKEYSVSNGSCLDALSQIYDVWKGVGWIHTYDHSTGTDVITIGRANVRDEENTSDAFSYGVGKGLTAIRKASANEGEFATRLYVYGSERNIQTRHYNKYDILNKDSVDICNLMLPIEKWGKANGLPDASKAYLEADASVIEKYGLIPRTIYFDGSENEEIYPSIEGLTCRDVRNQMIADGQGGSRYLPPDTEDRIDKVVSAYGWTTGTKEEHETLPYFYLNLNSVGFDIQEQGKLTAEGQATISFKSGGCAGREFKVREFHLDKFNRPELTLEKYWDDSLGQSFPNEWYPISEGDIFVLLDIPMPEYYISLAEGRLLEAGEKMLSDYTKVSAFYEPSVDPIEVKMGGKTLRAGMYMQVYDEDIIESEGNTDYVLISTLVIDESGELPTYRVTLRDEKRSARNFGALEDMIVDAKDNTKKEIEKQKKYSQRTYAQVRETMDMVEKALEGFQPGINPVTLETMAILVGSQTLQFKFIRSLEDTTKHTPAFDFNETTGIFSVPQSYLMHYTIGQNEITTSQNDDTKRKWEIDAFESEALIDGTKAYYLYAFVPENGVGAFELSSAPKSFKVSGGYNLLVGVLNTEFEGTRSFVPLYGYTEVLPGQITTDVIRSADGNTFFDLVNGVISGKIHFEAGSSGVENLDIKVGAYNLLRNSGFTGDYLSETLADDAVLDSSSQMFNDPLVHWSIKGEVDVVNLSGISTSGKGVVISKDDDDGEIYQSTYYNAIYGENYVVSFKAKSGKTAAKATIVFGGVSKTIDVAEEWGKYNVSITASTPSNDFRVRVEGSITLCDLQLERGTVASSWGNSWLDNSSDRAYWQSLKYLQSAMSEGYTEIGGGLILTNHIQVGDTANGQMTGHAPTGGMNGLMSDGKDSVFLWGGGTLQQAQNTVKGYKDNENWQPTEGELQALAKFVVTHGGRAILNDMILRGYVYALGGKIGGLEIKDGGIYTQTNTGGEVLFTPVGLIARQADGSFTELGTCGSHAIMVNGKDAGGQCYLNEDLYKIAAQINAANGYHAIHSLSGMYAGLRPNIRKITASDILTELDHTVILSNAGTITLTLPSSPQTGQTYKIIHTNTNGVLFSHPDGDMIINVYEGGGTVMTSFEEQKTLTLTYLDHIWYAEINN